MKKPDLLRLRLHAISHSLFHETTLKAAIDRLGFVQADPIRSPARAQDLILRHRVKAYRSGDLERHYSSLNLEEDRLYAYGFLPRSIQRLLHSRSADNLSKFEKEILDTVGNLGSVHPAELEVRFGNERARNAWGGFSKATTRALEALHHRGLLRVARRENGIRVYGVAPTIADSLEPNERLRKIVMLISNILAPVPTKTLRKNIARYQPLGNPRAVLDDLIRTGELEQQAIDGLTYVWPPPQGTIAGEAPPALRFLAPFDPLIWDRSRFEHLWGWPYRFEAYTPPAKRLRGYYAMPLLWGDNMIGWGNASVVDGKLTVDLGFAGKRPRGADFRSALDDEIARMELFLGLKK